MADIANRTVYPLVDSGEAIAVDPLGRTRAINTNGETIYSKYVAMLSQESTSNPTVTVFENSIGEGLVWTREGIGTYRITKVGAFTTNKTYIKCNYGGENPNLSLNPNLIESEDYIEIVNYDTFVHTAADGMQNAFIEIRIYN